MKTVNFSTRGSESLKWDPALTASVKDCLEKIRSLPKEQALQHLREHWRLVLPKDPGSRILAAYGSLLQHHKGNP